MDEFADKVVWVTGAGSGIGFAICRHFAQGGATVVLNDISERLAQPSPNVRCKNSPTMLTVGASKFPSALPFRQTTLLRRFSF